MIKFLSMKARFIWRRRGCNRPSTRKPARIFWGKYRAQHRARTPICYLILKPQAGFWQPCPKPPCQRCKRDFKPQVTRSHGPFRLVKYAQFLFREVFHEHDRLCRQDGEWMISYLAGDSEAGEHLAALKRAVENFYEKNWA